MAKVETENADLPKGGTTGLCHQTSAAIDEAARWFAVNRDACERPVVVALRRRFGLLPIDAVAAIVEANRILGACVRR